MIENLNLCSGYVDATSAWYRILRTIFGYGIRVEPRGKATLEVPHLAAAFRMNRPALICAPRKPYYRFMAAEALWILSGSDRVEDIAPYNKNMQEFSDNGRTFFGAYGPPVAGQLDYVVKQLARDPESRQAVMTIWRQNPGPSKDIPCTLAIQFTVRFNELNAHVYMRSSDAWLGVPYDFFTFSMIACKVACLVNLSTTLRPISRLGMLYWTAGSSHLYEENWLDARRCLEYADAPSFDPVEADLRFASIDESVVRAGRWDAVENALSDARDQNRLPNWPTVPA
jgi:thymidylate synthase